MSDFLLDTCAVSEFAKLDPNSGFLAWASKVDPARTYLSAITIGELHYGIALAHQAQRVRLESWLTSEVLAEFGPRVLGFDAPVSQRWGAMRASARRTGVTLSALDAAIAATALHYELTLVTRNERDFADANVTTFNPWT